MSEPDAPNNFITDVIRCDNEAGIYGDRIQIRFPPEPNGFLHIGHAKAIVVDFGTAEDSGGTCMLRLDDTNLETEEEAFVNSIVEDIEWLGHEPFEVRHASNYFETLHDWAVQLIEKGLAYVDDQDGETISATRGSFNTPGIESPFRNRSVAENLDLFGRMRAGKFPDDPRVLRARIDIARENMQLRDPVMYRIRNIAHHRTGETWSIYPTYDWARGRSDVIKGVIYSICTLEFESHRPPYDWFLEQLEAPSPPCQYESVYLELTHITASKCCLVKPAANGVVDGWDDPQMSIIQGLWRHDHPAEAIRAFCREVGTICINSRKVIEELESYACRELNVTAQRRMVVTRSLKPTLLDQSTESDGGPLVEWLEVVSNLENPAGGTRLVPFIGEPWIEQSDFREVPPPKYFRLSSGREVRLRGSYLITARDMVKDEAGNITEVRYSFDPEPWGGTPADGRRMKLTMHWVSVPHALDATVAPYDRLFTAEAPGERTGETLDDLNPASRGLLTGAKVEPALADATPGEVVQFERLGYFVADDHTPLLFYRTVGLRDEWASIQKYG